MLDCAKVSIDKNIIHMGMIQGMYLSIIWAHAKNKFPFHTKLNAVMEKTKKLFYAYKLSKT